MKIGFIGAGSMASALARGLGEPALVYDVDGARAEALAAEIGGTAVASNRELAEGVGPRDPLPQARPHGGGGRAGRRRREGDRLDRRHRAHHAAGVRVSGRARLPLHPEHPGRGGARGALLRAGRPGRRGPRGRGAEALRARRRGDPAGRAADRPGDGDHELRARLPRAGGRRDGRRRAPGTASSRLRPRGWSRRRWPARPPTSTPTASIRGS